MTQWRLRPARDLDLSFSQRLRSLRREQGLIGVMGQIAWLAVIRLYLAAVHRLRVSGREHLPAAAPFVLVANHASHLDVLCLLSALPWRLARRAVALAAGDVFFRALPRAIFTVTAMNALPIWRDGTTAADLALLRTRLLEDGLVYCLFPEGTRARGGVMARFRPGLGAFVAGTAVPVIPCWIDGAHAAWPPQRTLPRPGRLAVRIGPALSFADAPNSRAGWIAAAASAEAAVRALGP